MSGAWAPTIQETEKLALAVATVPLVGTGTSTIMTATGGDILIQDVSFYLKTAAAGLVALSVQTNDTSPTTFLASIVLLSLLGVKNLAPANTGLTFLPQGKALTLAISGTGTAGSLVVMTRFYKTAIGASLG